MAEMHRRYTRVRVKHNEDGSLYVRIEWDGGYVELAGMLINIPNEDTLRQILVQGMGEEPVDIWVHRYASGRVAFAIGEEPTSWPEEAP